MMYPHPDHNGPVNHWLLDLAAAVVIIIGFVLIVRG